MQRLHIGVLCHFSRWHPPSPWCICSIRPHLKDLGQLVAREIEAAGGVAKEFNTIAVDDGIAMGHDGMLYSLPFPRADRRFRRVHGQRALRRRDGVHLELRQDHPGMLMATLASTSRRCSSQAGRWSRQGPAPGHRQ